LLSRFLWNDNTTCTCVRKTITSEMLQVLLGGKCFHVRFCCSGRLIKLPTYCDYYCNNRHDVMSSSWINSIVTGYPPNRCTGRLSKYLRTLRYCTRIARIVNTTIRICNMYYIVCHVGVVACFVNTSSLRCPLR